MEAQTWRTAIALALALSTTDCIADIFECRDPQGNKRFTNLAKEAERLGCERLDVSIPNTVSAAKAEPNRAALSRADADKRINKMSNNTFCVEIGRTLRLPTQPQPYTEVLLNHATQNYGVVAQDHSFISTRRLRIGMNWCSVLAAWGAPIDMTRSTTASGTRIQLVYDRRRYAYLDNQILSGWQD